MHILRGINRACVDLVYLDPPFNKQKEFVAPRGSKADGARFRDAFRPEDVHPEWLQTIEAESPNLYLYLTAIRGMLGDRSYVYCYLVYMAIRVLELHRVLKQTGSLYLHCDPTMSHYLKLMLDAIFGIQQFRNEIIWRYRSGGASKRYYPRKHDVILYYLKSERASYTFHPQREPYSAIITPQYADKFHPEGKMMASVWDIPRLSNTAHERTGYPTQKPLALLHAILKTSSSAGDVVLDPFCGSATTLISAESLDRQWIGIDVSPQTYDLLLARLQSTLPPPPEATWQAALHATSQQPKRSN